MADHAQEFGPHPLDFFQRRQILKCDDDRLDRTVGGPDRRGVDERRDAAPVGGQDHDLLGAHRLADAQEMGERQLGKRDFTPIGATDGQHFQEFLRRAVRRIELAYDSSRFLVDRHWLAGSGV